eukprot:CAMPEP_0178903840 /NCGR_PEP_ID=MMETSP0786-20121207/5373_1 /TAXON_ID=186022 /ORGANISM="Thalassionema frauenfeldii, Strain CCMP 1798" /LENGTH=1220 /DNA_ID=CAMNT_0020575241 /DNA_START=105 /DNA_END=3767 /DNA_ORIENTATION=+
MPSLASWNTGATSHWKMIKILILGIGTIAIIVSVNLIEQTGTIRSIRNNMRSLRCIHGKISKNSRVLCSIETQLETSTFEEAFPEPETAYDADYDTDQPQGTVAFVVTIPSCPEDTTHPPADDDPSDAFYDAAAFLRHSVCNCTARNPDSGSTVESTFYAIVHPSAVSCLAPSGNENYDRVKILQELGYWVIIWAEPVSLSELPSNSYVRDNINNEDGIRDMLKIHAYDLTNHPVAVLMNFDSIFLNPIDDIITSLQGSTNVKSYHVTKEDQTTVNAGMLFIKPNETEFNSIKYSFKSTTYDASNGWGGLGYQGLGLVEGFLTYYYSLNPSENVEYSPTSMDDYVVSFANKATCQKPWDCHYDDNWNTEIEDECRALNSAWYTYRQDFEQKWSKTDLVDTSQAPQSTFYPAFFHGYCSGNGASGYLRAADHQGTATASTVTVTYPEEADRTLGLANPMRGFYWQQSYRASFTNQRLSAQSLISERESTDMTVLLRLYYFDSFIQSNISQPVLDDIEADFQTLRDAGMKCVLRFAYLDRDPNPGESTEPILSQILDHIAQLKPYLTDNQDVILVMQAGFVGPWGEFHSSTNFPNKLDDGADQIIEAVLDAVPNRNVQLRYPGLKKSLYEEFQQGPQIGTYLPQGDFESGGWLQYGDGFTSVTSEFHSGSQSIKVVGSAGDAGAKASPNINLSSVATENRVIVISGYSKAINIPVSGSSSAYSIYVDLVYTDNSAQYGITAPFTRGTHDWEYAEREFVGKTVNTVSLYAIYRYDAVGEAYFDDFQVTVRDPPLQTAGFVLNETTAHNGSAISRTGHHNDCFLASDTDFGTYEDNTQSEYPYLSQETKYTSMGGETCYPNPPRSNCSTATAELSLFHYTYLNSGYRQEVLDSWVGICMDNITAQLGYRLVLTDGTFSTSAEQGGLVEYEINFENVGYSAVLDERRVQLVLRKGESYCAATDNSVDARTWYGGESGMISGSLSLPSDIETGDYELLLHITDPDTELRRRLEYKSKVANGGTLNEEDTGLIDLNHTLTISSGSGSQGSSALQVICGIEDDILPPPPPPLVTNGGFEGNNVASDWDIYSNGYSVVTNEMHSGSQSISISDGGARQILDLTSDPVPENYSIVISGWSKAVGVSNNLGSDYSIYTDMRYTDGNDEWGENAVFSGGTSTVWEYANHTFVVPAGKSVDRITLYAMYRNDAGSPSGVAYFDDISVQVTAAP